MDLLEFCANLNKEGAALLASNNSLPAFEHFRGALQILVQSIPHGNMILNSCPTLSHACRSLLQQPLPYHWLLLSMDNPSIMMPANTITVRPDEGDNDQQKNNHIFGKAFVFQPQQDQERPLELRVRTYIALTFFNLAATIHRRSASQRFDRALKVALELYDVGFDVLIQEESCCIDDWATNISLAILNNMAEVHWSLSDFAKANRVLELQKGLLDIIFSNKRPHNFSDQEMETFILNTHLLRAPSGAAAA
jgi:hypothetical protein